jgi:prophage regulatory protein
MTDPSFKYDPSLELWRLPKVIEKVGLGRSSILAMVKDGKFPEPRRVGAAAVAWRSSDIMEWMQALPVASPDNAA